MFTDLLSPHPQSIIDSSVEYIRISHASVGQVGAGSIDPLSAWRLCREHAAWLSLREWQVASLRFDEGLDWDQISEELGIPEYDVVQIFSGLMSFLNEVAIEACEIMESA
ncbi:MAG: hypothetical protein ACE37H_11955 [Phycisphaeraceae bacterium]